MISKFNFFTNFRISIIYTVILLSNLILGVFSYSLHKFISVDLLSIFYLLILNISLTWIIVYSALVSFITGEQVLINISVGIIFYYLLFSLFRFKNLRKFKFILFGVMIVSFCIIIKSFLSAILNGNQPNYLLICTNLIITAISYSVLMKIFSKSLCDLAISDSKIL